MTAHTDENFLLHGGVRALTLRLSLPGLFSMLACGLSTLLDAMFLSRAGSEAAAAAGLCFPLVTVIQTIGFTMGTGAGSFISRLLGKNGARSGGDAAQAASAALYSAIALGVFFCLPGFLFTPHLLRLLGAKETLALPTAAYARFLLAAGPMTCASLVLSSLLRGQGHTACAMTAYGAGLVLGGCLSALLVVDLGFGISGAGAALVAREALVLLFFIYYTLRIPGALRPMLREFTLKPHILSEIMRSGLPTLVRQGLTCLSGVFLSRLCAQLGTHAVAGIGLAQRAVSLVSSAIIGFGQGFSPVCGAAYGAGRMERLREAYRFCLRLLSFSLTVIGAAAFFCAPLLARFAPDEPSARLFSLALRLQSITFFAQGAVILMNMLTQSMGLPLRATLVASGRQGYVLIPLLFLLPLLWGEWGLLLAQPLSDLISLAIGWALTRKIISGKGKAGGIAPSA